MKKIFTLTAAVLASFSLWAADPDVSISNFTVNDTTQYLKLYSGNNGATVAIHQNNPKALTGWQKESGESAYYFKCESSQGTAAGPAGIRISASYKIDSISLLLTANSANKEVVVGAIGWEADETTFSNIATDYAGTFPAVTASSKKIGDAKWTTLDLSKKELTTVAIAKQFKSVVVGTASKADFPSTGAQSFFLYGIKVWVAPSCTDPEFTVPEGGTGFVGDPINLAITSKNNSKPVNYAVTVDGVKGVADTDYSFNVSPGLVQATPLKAGTFVITFSQASDGTYCDAEDSATFVISAKTPVTSFEIDAPATAHVGEEVTIELKNFDAAPTSIVWYDGEFNEITAANGKTSYTFTPEATGKYAFQITAWNDFNELNGEAFNHTEIKVVVGTDATLSDLKVNGATLGDFATNKYEYAIGEFGVYEAINVTATAADAPYATVEVVDDKAGTITVTVTAEDKTTTQNYVMTYTRKAATELVAISESTTWDWTETGETADLQLSDATMPKKTEEFNFADLLKNPGENFKAASLEGIMEYVYRKQSDYKFCQGTQLRFVTTVAGKLEVVYSNTGTRSKETERRFLVVNGKSYGEGTMNATPVTTSNIAVVAGEVVISSIINDGKETASMLRFNKVVFTKDDSSTALDNTEAEAKAVKVVRDGQLLILKNGVLYNAQGAVVK